MNALAIELGAAAALIFIALWLSVSLFKQRELLRQENIKKKEWIDRGNHVLSEILHRDNINPHKLVKSIESFTSLQAWFTELETVHVSEDQLKSSPFWIDPYLTSMALSTGKSVQQHQLSQWGWAFAYIPFIQNGKIQGIMALSAAKQTSLIGQSFDLLLAEFICASYIAKG